MNKRVLHLILLTGLLLLVSCAGKKQYEWIKIKSPSAGNEYAVHKAGPRKVNVLVRLTEKKNHQYVEDSGEFFNKYPLSDSGELLSRNQKTGIKNKVRKSRATVGRSKDNPEDFVHKDEGLSASTLNNSVILPDESEQENPLPEYDIENKKNLSVKELFPEFSDVLAEDESPDKKGEFIWAGLILVILGIISGLIFGRYTYLISVGGLLLIAIGYYLGI